jgi:Uma2 family endonuclease
VATSEEQRFSRPAHGLLRRHRLTAGEYRRMGQTGILRPDARVELIDGEIIDMAPTGSRHAGVVRHIARLLERAVGDAALVSIQSPVSLGEHSEPEPDIALLQPRADFYKADHPQAADVFLIIEVADASLRYDRQIKVPLYARQGITEVWLVDLEQDGVTCYRDPARDGYRLTLEIADLHATSPALLPGASIDLAATLAR